MPLIYTHTITVTLAHSPHRRLSLSLSVSIVINPSSPNVAREIALDLNLPPHVTGVTVSRACLSGMQAVVSAVEMIEHGDADCIIAGGGDSMSSGLCVRVHASVLLYVGCVCMCVCVYVIDFELQCWRNGNFRCVFASLSHMHAFSLSVRS